MSQIYTISSTSSPLIVSSTYSSILGGGWNTYIGTSTFSFPRQKTKYIILGEECELESSYQDPYVGIIISLINCTGIQLYEEMKKNGVTFSKEIEKILEKKLKAEKRNRKIKIVMDDKS